MTTLRKGTIAVGVAVLVAAVVLFVAAGALPGLVGLGCWALVLVVGLAIERWRYKAILGAPPGPEWRSNGERFVDPETGRMVAVYEEPASGRRVYVAADA
jgi:hypothetical protein